MERAWLKCMMVIVVYDCTTIAPISCLGATDVEAPSQPSGDLPRVTYLRQTRAAPVVSVDVSGELGLLAAGSADGILKIWSLPELRIRIERELQPEEEWEDAGITSVRFDERRDRILCATRSAGMRLVNTVNGKATTVGRLRGMTLVSDAVLTAAEGRMSVVAGTEAAVFGPLLTGTGGRLQRIRVRELPGAFLHEAIISPDGRYVAALTESIETVTKRNGAELRWSGDPRYISVTDLHGDREMRDVLGEAKEGIDSQAAYVALRSSALCFATDPDVLYFYRAGQPLVRYAASHSDESRWDRQELGVKPSELWASAMCAGRTGSIYIAAQDKKDTFDGAGPTTLDRDVRCTILVLRPRSESLERLAEISIGPLRNKKSTWLDAVQAMAYSDDPPTVFLALRDGRIAVVRDGRLRSTNDREADQLVGCITCYARMPCPWAQ